jgi:hypothetical protein
MRGRALRGRRRFLSASLAALYILMWSVELEVEVPEDSIY